MQLVRAQQGMLSEEQVQKLDVDREEREAKREADEKEAARMAKKAGKKGAAEGAEPKLDSLFDEPKLVEDMVCDAALQLHPFFIL